MTKQQTAIALSVAVAIVIALIVTGLYFSSNSSPREIGPAISVTPQATSTPSTSSTDTSQHSPLSTQDSLDIASQRPTLSTEDPSSNNDIPADIDSGATSNNPNNSSFLTPSSTNDTPRGGNE
ncbi:MAG: hypothetical protein Q4P66_00825 [Actinomycetaceae bacterium]|nr:hypothetical protein [Actinomycetaceae bacterium]